MNFNKTPISGKFRHYFPITWFSIFLLAIFFSVSTISCTPQSSVRQKQIDRERQKKERQAYKAYQKELKQHLKMQSKRTREMMKKTRKNSRKVTPNMK